MTQTTITKAPPAGITQLPDPCWELVYASSGDEWDEGDGSPHFVDQAEADAFAESLDDDGPALKARQINERCWTATATCGLPFEDEGGSVPHWSTAAEALTEVKDYDWSVRDGVLRCEDGNDCQPVAPKVEL